MGDNTGMNKTSVFCSTKLESKPCSRCGGEGKLWHFSSVHGGVCFKCQGQKVLLTKRGRAANDYLIRLRSVRADSLKPGDLVRENGTTNGLNIVTSFFTVQHVTPLTPENAGGCVFVNGLPVLPPPSVRVEYGHGNLGGLITQYENDKLVRVACSAEFKAATLRQALAFQSTLTKAGKVTQATADFFASDPSSRLPANVLEKKI